ncbi:MAG: DUF47 family protein [Chloroflexi bacterium]|nr:DUF47 family protein [Chloroflexota bacterium]
MNFFSFTTKANPIFELLKEQASITGETGALLSRVFEHPEESADTCRKINETTREGESKTYDILVKINKTMITPIDRGDLFALAYGMEEILKTIRGISGRFGLFEISKTTETSRELGKNLAVMTGKIKTWLENIESKTPMEEWADNIDEQLEKSDLLLRLGLGELFDKEAASGASAVLNTIQWIQIYDRMELTVESCGKLSRVIEGILIRNGWKKH